MNIRYANHPRPHSSRPRLFCRRILTDVLPTLLLLFAMALGMSLVARYAESSHFKPVITDGQILQQFSG